MKRWMAGTAAFLLAVGCCTSAYAQKKKAVEPLLLDIPIIKSGTKDEVSPPGTGPYEFAETKLTRCKNWWRDTKPLVDFDDSMGW